MKLFECIIDDGTNVFKSTVAAKNKKELMNVYGGNGEFIRIKDVTNNYFSNDIVACLTDLDCALSRAGYGRNEITVLCALLEQHLNDTFKGVTK